MALRKDKNGGADPATDKVGGLMYQQLRKLINIVVS